MTLGTTIVLDSERCVRLVAWVLGSIEWTRTNAVFIWQEPNEFTSKPALQHRKDINAHYHCTTSTPLKSLQLNCARNWPAIKTKLICQWWAMLLKQGSLSPVIFVTRIFNRKKPRSRHCYNQALLENYSIQLVQLYASRHPQNYALLRRK
jgi:hypothetical protein